uniref:Uncharacterized protein n=1 Tax=Oryza glumipatula TaxID=40148 RepID=A0A0E0AJ55_9ORYZ
MATVAAASCHWRQHGGWSTTMAVAGCCGNGALTAEAATQSSWRRSWALSCCLTPQGWLLGESPILAPLSPDGRWRRFSVASLLEDIVLAPPSYRTISSVFLCWSSGGRSRLAAAGPVLAFSWSCVLALSVCEGWYIFSFSWLRPSRVVIL